MKHLESLSRWTLVAIVFSVIGFAGQTAQAWHVVDYGNGGFLDINYQVQAREVMSPTGSGSTGQDSTNNFYLRRDRLSFLGAINDTYGYALQFEYVGGKKIGETDISTKGDDYVATVLDAYVTANYSDALNLRVGRTKHVLTREVSEGCFDPLSTDRSAFINGPFTQNVWNAKTTRDVGITAMGNFFSDVLQYRVGIMQGNNYADASRPADAGWRYTGRLHLSLLDPEAGWGYRGSYLGKKKVLTLGAGYEMEPKAVFADGTTGSEDYKAYTLDAFYEQPTEFGTFTLSTAYLNADFGNAGTRGVAGAGGINGEKNGYYWKGGYMLGKFQVYGRNEKWSFAQLGPVGQIVTYRSEGVNYYINGQELRLTLEFAKTSFDKDHIQPIRALTAQLQARF